MSFLDSMDIGGVGNIASGLSGGDWTDLFGAGDAKKAAEEQRQGYEEAGGVYKEAGRNAMSRYAPYAASGRQANRMIQDVMRGDYSSFTESPDYQFRLDQGEQALERGAAARGMNLSGATLKDLGEYSQGLASTEYGNWYNRLAGQQGLGANVAGQQAGVDMGTADRYASTVLGQAGARASGYMADANIKNYMASSMHESGQRIGEAWATMGMGGGGGGMSGGGGLGGGGAGYGGFNYGANSAPAAGGGTWYGPFAGG